jgi:hypothetical protein
VRGMLSNARGDTVLMLPEEELRAILSSLPRTQSMARGRARSGSTFCLSAT